MALSSTQTSLHESMMRRFLLLIFSVALVGSSSLCSWLSAKHLQNGPALQRTLQSQESTALSPSDKQDPVDEIENESIILADRNLITFPKDQVEMIMPIGGQDQALDADLPELITGLCWFADLLGSTLTSAVGSFAGATWNAKKRTIPLETSVPRVWAWRGDADGQSDAKLFASLSALNQAYFFSFDETMTTIQIQPQVTIFWKFTIRVPVFLFDFFATRVDDNTWFLERTVLWSEWDPYFMRRIVDKSGVRLPIYSEFLRNATDTLVAIDNDD